MVFMVLTFSFVSCTCSSILTYSYLDHGKFFKTLSSTDFQLGSLINDHAEGYLHDGEDQFEGDGDSQDAPDHGWTGDQPWPRLQNIPFTQAPDSCT